MFCNHSSTGIQPETIGSSSPGTAPPARAYRTPGTARRTTGTVEQLQSGRVTSGDGLSNRCGLFLEISKSWRTCFRGFKCCSWGFHAIYCGYNYVISGDGLSNRCGLCLEISKRCYFRVKAMY